MSNKAFMLVFIAILWLALPKCTIQLMAYFQRLNPVTQTAGQWTTGKRASVSHSFIFSKGGLRHIFYETEYDTSGNVTKFTPYRIEVWPIFNGPVESLVKSNFFTRIK